MSVSVRWVVLVFEPFLELTVLADLVRGMGLEDRAPVTLVYKVVDHTEMVMDVYMPSGAGPAPGVLVIHGGGWSGGTRSEFSGLSRYLATRGYVVASLDYRLAPRWPYPAARDDAPMDVQRGQCRLKRFTADVVEVDVDSVWRCY